MWNFFKKLFGFQPKKIEDLPKMTLEDFLSEAVIQLANGIQKAQEATSGKLSESDKEIFKCYIAPYNPGPKDNVHLIDFDLAITLEKKSSNSNRFNISVVGAPVIDINLKSKNDTSEISSVISRMKFSIPIIYPSSPNPTIPK